MSTTDEPVEGLFHEGETVGRVGAYGFRAVCRTEDESFKDSWGMARAWRYVKVQVLGLFIDLGVDDAIGEGDSEV